jgi:hypothetical protein
MPDLAGPGRASWLLVVDPAQRELYELMQERLQGTAVEVVRERRHGASRRELGEPPADQRRPERHGRPVAQVYAVAGGATQGQVETRDCPDCGVVFEFERPPLALAPNVTTTVVHRLDPSFGIQHYIEFTVVPPVGPPTVQRVQARRRMPKR